MQCPWLAPLPRTSTHQVLKCCLLHPSQNSLQRGDGYVAGLNLRRRFIIPSPPPAPPLPAYATGPMDSSSSGGGLSGGAMIGAIVGACGGFAVLTALVAGLVVRQMRRRRGLFGKAKAPGVGPDTTLVVTDVEGSTTLWCVALSGPQMWPPAAQGWMLTGRRLRCLNAGRRCPRSS